MIFYAVVDKVDSDGTIWVHKRQGPKSTGLSVPAYPTSISPPDPEGKGGGIFVCPEKGNTCICVEGPDGKWYILSYYSVLNISKKDISKNAPDVSGDQNPGTIKFTTKGSNFIELALNGVNRLFSGPRIYLSISKLSEAFEGWFHRFSFKTVGGYFRWHDSSQGKTELRMMVTDKAEQPKNSDEFVDFETSRDGAVPRSSDDLVYSDKLLIGVGNISEGHLLQVESRQSIGKTANPDTLVLTKVGKSVDNYHLSTHIETQDGSHADVRLMNTESGILSHRGFTAGSNSLNEYINSDGGYKLIVNEDKAILFISADGNISITVDNGKNITLQDKQGGIQQLATKAMVDKYATHVHLGNLGAPTSPPMNPFGTPESVNITATPGAQNVPSELNYYTVITKAG